MGAQLGRLWADKGHSVIAGLREGGRGTETAKKLGISAATPAAAVREADVTVLAVPWQAVEGTLASLGALEGKILIDATNPLAKDLTVMTSDAGSAGEQVAQWARGARVVKAFNTIGAALFGDPAFDMFYCGDDADAKQTARCLIEDTTMTPIDVGPLKNATHLEHLAGFWIELAVNGRMPGAFGFKLARHAR